MDFGKLELDELNALDFTLPKDRPGTVQILNGQRKAGETQIFVGCAKWGRKDWIGKIYPAKTKESDFLKHYGTHFNSIELNATFYRTPTEKQTAAWAAQVGNGFKFAPKFTQRITHFKRLKEAEEATSRFLKGVMGFGEHLGPLFLQLPPNFPAKNFETLRTYLQSLPKDVDVFVELRHPNWFEPDMFDQVFDMLEENGAGSVITDASGRRDCVHMRLTTPDAFIRFVGNGLHPTDYVRIDHWVQRIKSWMQLGIRNIYFFMHQHEELHSPELCKYAIQQLNKQCGTSIAEPVFVKQ